MCDQKLTFFGVSCVAVVLHLFFMLSFLFSPCSLPLFICMCVFVLFWGVFLVFFTLAFVRLWDVAVQFVDDPCNQNLGGSA